MFLLWGDDPEVRDPDWHARLAATGVRRLQVNVDDEQVAGALRLQTFDDPVRAVVSVWTPGDAPAGAAQPDGGGQPGDAPGGAGRHRGGGHRGDAPGAADPVSGRELGEEAAARGQPESAVQRSGEYVGPQ